MTTRSVLLRLVLLFVLFPIVLLLLSTSQLAISETASSEDLAWTEDRYDLNNTGHVMGEGVMSDPEVLYGVSLPDDRFYSRPVVVDLSLNGSMELVYVTLGGNLSVRNGHDGSVITERSYGEKILVPPVVHHVNGDEFPDLIVLTYNRTSDLTTLHFLDGTDMSEIATMGLVDTPRACGKIEDVDEDGRDELVVTTRQGYVYSIDLGTRSVDWRTFVHIGLVQPVALFRHGGSFKVAVTSGIYLDTFGSEVFYLLNGSDGDIDWEYDTGESFISTPPTVFEDGGGGPLVAFANGNGTVFVLSVEDREPRLRIEKDRFEQNPGWLNVACVGGEGSEGHLLVLQGQSGCAGVDPDDGRILWSEYYDYFSRKKDSLCADMDGDGEVELVLLGRYRLELFDAIGGESELAITTDIKMAGGLVVADLDGDGFLDMCIFSDSQDEANELQVLTERLYISLRNVSLDGLELQEGSAAVRSATLFAMYRQYSLEFAFAATSSMVEALGWFELTFDPGSLGFRETYSVLDGTFSTDWPWYLFMTEVDLLREKGHAVLRLRYYVNWTFPHEEPFGIHVAARLKEGRVFDFDLSDVLRVENDVEISGELDLFSNASRVEEGDWLLPGDIIEGSGLHLSYEGDASKRPPPADFIMEVVSGPLLWPANLREDSEVDFNLDLSPLSTGEHVMSVRSSASPPSADVGTYQFTVRVDSEPVEVLGLHPVGSWCAVGEDVCIGVTATDGNGSGISLTSVEVRVAGEGSSLDSEDWMGYGTLSEVGPGVLRFSIVLDLPQGVHLFQWRLRDVAGNPYTLSEVRSLTVNDTLVRFHDFQPVGWVGTRLVTATITIELMVPCAGPVAAFAAGASVDSLDDWNEVECSLGYMGNHTLSVVHSFDEGRDNYIRWRVALNATVVVFSGTYQVLVDTLPPRFGEPSPDLGAVHDGSGLEVTVPVFDDGSGVNASSVGYQLSSSSDFADAPWESMHTQLVDGDIVGRVSFEGLTGKSNFIRFRALDVVGNPYAVSEAYRIRMNEPPRLLSLSPANNSLFDSGEVVTFHAEVADPDPSDEVSAEWTSDIDGHLGSDLEMRMSNLSVGVHLVTLTISDGHGHLTSHSIVITVKDEPSEDGPLFRIKGTSWFFLLLLVAASVAIAVFHLRGRARE